MSSSPPGAWGTGCQVLHERMRRVLEPSSRPCKYSTILFRDVKKGEEVAQEIAASNPSSKGKIDVLKLELDDLQSVRQCATDFLSKSKQLNALITNAGIMACPEGKTKDGFELQFGTNHVGHFLLFQLLKPALLASSTPSYNSRVVSVSPDLQGSCLRTSHVLIALCSFACLRLTALQHVKPVTSCCCSTGGANVSPVRAAVPNT